MLLIRLSGAFSAGRSPKRGDHFVGLIFTTRTRTRRGLCDRNGMTGSGPRAVLVITEYTTLTLVISNYACDYHHAGGLADRRAQPVHSFVFHIHSLRACTYIGLRDAINSRHKTRARTEVSRPVRRGERVFTALSSVQLTNQQSTVYRVQTRAVFFFVFSTQSFPLRVSLLLDAFSR